MSQIFRSQHLSDMLDALQPLVSATQDYELENELARMRSTYTTMLHYMVQGVEDPNATQLYVQLRQQAYVISDRAHRLKRLREQAGEKYCITHKYLKHDYTLDTALLALDTHCRALRQAQQEPRESIRQHDQDLHATEHDNALVTMFDYVWTSDVWLRSDYEKAVELLTTDTIDTEDKCLLVSATTLALLEMFDERKVMLLFDAYLHTETEINQRAIVGIVLVCQHYDQRIPQFAEVAARLSLHMEDQKFVRDTFRTMMQLQHSRLTENISARMRDDIIPSIMRSNHFRKTQMGIQEIDDYMTQNGENPEWHHNEADATAQDKIREMAELQMEGADVYMSTFAHMKGYAFFHTLAHWLMPFTLSHPALSKSLQLLSAGTSSSSVLSGILHAAPFCSSDKYSFCLMIDSIGQPGRDMLSTGIASQIDANELDEQFKELATRRPKAKDVRRNYVYDLYRLFKIYPYHLQFPNPFAVERAAFSPVTINVFSPLLQHTDEVVSLAEFFMRKGFYTEAIALFTTLQPQPREDDADIWQKIGFCQQKNGNLQAAYENYATAFRLKPSSQWTLKHLAQTAFHLNLYTEAEAYYDLLLDDDADNLRYLTRKIECCIQTSRPADAIPLLYKATYLNEDAHDLQDRLAWCLLLDGKTEKARTIYDTLTAASPTATILIHAAYALFLDGQSAAAYDHFRRAYTALPADGNRPANFKQQFFDAAHALQPIGIDLRRCEMLYDAVRLG